MQLLSLIIHLILCYLFVSVFDGREIGAALATNITYFINMIGLELYCCISESVKQTYIGRPDRRVFLNIGTFLALSIPSALMTCFEWWCFEILAIFAGLIDIESLAAQVICVNILSLIYMLPLGASYAASAFTGYFLGKMKIEQGKKYSRLTIVFNILVTLLIIIVLLVFHDQITVLFTKDRATVKIIGKVLYFMTVFIFFDTIHGVQVGIIRGLGL